MRDIRKQTRREKILLRKLHSPKSLLKQLRLKSLFRPRFFAMVTNAKHTWSIIFYLCYFSIFMKWLCTSEIQLKNNFCLKMTIYNGQAIDIIRKRVAKASFPLKAKINLQARSEYFDPIRVLVNASSEVAS